MIKAELEKKSFYVEDAWRKRDNLTVGVSVDRKELCIKLSDANLAIDQIVKEIDYNIKHYQTKEDIADNEGNQVLAAFYDGSKLSLIELRNKIKNT